MSKAPYRIDRAIPFPGQTKSEAGRPAVYPFADMEVGDSFFVPSKERFFSSESSLSSSITRARKELDFNLVWRREKGGFRIWRLEGGYRRKAETGQPRVRKSKARAS